MRMLISVGTAALLLSAFAVATAAAGAPSPSGMVKLSVAQGAHTYGQKTASAKPGLIEIFFTNNSTAPHNVSLEHNGEYEFGSTLTIRKGSTVSFLTLAKGTYHVYSSVGKDEDKGMAATLVVK
jgi:plastocyanin